MNSRILLYEGKPRYDLWLKLIIGGVPAFTLILGLVFITPADADRFLEELNKARLSLSG